MPTVRKTRIGVRAAALALSALLSLSLMQVLTYGMAQQSGGVSLAQHMQAPRPAAAPVLARTAAAPTSAALRLVRRHGV